MMVSPWHVSQVCKQHPVISLHVFPHRPIEQHQRHLQIEIDAKGLAQGSSGGSADMSSGDVPRYVWANALGADPSIRADISLA